MAGSFGKESDGESGDTGGVEDDGDVVEILQDADTKCVDEAVGDEHSGVDAEGLGWSGLVVRALDGGHGGHESRQPERDARRHGHLAQQVEPTRYPCRKGRPGRRRHHGRPEIWSATRRDGRNDFAHGHSHHEREEGHDNPAAAHHRWTARVQAILKQRGQTGYNALGRRELVLVYRDTWAFAARTLGWELTMIENDTPKLCARPYIRSCLEVSNRTERSNRMFIGFLCAIEHIMYLMGSFERGHI